MIKLVAIDMDGTLLTSQNEISKENKEAIQKAIKMGVHVMIATGRNYPDATELLYPAGLIIPVISMNGAQINSAAGELIHTVRFEHKKAQDVHQVAKAEHIYHEVFTDQGVFPCQDTYEQLIEDFRQGAFRGVVSPKRIEQRLERIGTQIAKGEHIEQIIQNPDVSFFKFVLFSYRSEKLQQVRHRLKSIDQLSITSSFRNNIEVNHPDGEKGKALSIMAKRLGIPMQHTMAIGDNWNDLSMFRAAGLSIAMGNAEPELARNCDHITKINDEHGVAYAFDQWVFGNA